MMGWTDRLGFCQSGIKPDNIRLIGWALLMASSYLSRILTNVFLQERASVRYRLLILSASEARKLLVTKAQAMYFET